MRKEKLKIGDEVAYKQNSGSFPCKAKVVGFRPGQKGICLRVNFSYTVFNTEPNDTWEVMYAHGRQVFSYWWTYEKWNRENRKDEAQRVVQTEHHVVLSDRVKSELEDRGIDFLQLAGGFTFSVNEMAKLLGIRLFLVKSE